MTGEKTEEPYIISILLSGKFLLYMVRLEKSDSYTYSNGPNEATVFYDDTIVRLRKHNSFVRNDSILERIRLRDYTGIDEMSKL